MNPRFNGNILFFACTQLGIKPSAFPEDAFTSKFYVNIIVLELVHTSICIFVGIVTNCNGM